MMQYIDPFVFIMDPSTGIPPEFVILAGGVVTRTILLSSGLSVQVIAHNPYVREVFYDGIPVGLFELDPRAGGLNDYAS